MLNPIEAKNIRNAQAELNRALNFIEFLSGVYQESDKILHNDFVYLKDRVVDALNALDVLGADNV